VTGPWILFAPQVEGDEALENSAWIAEKCRALSPAPVVILGGAGATRASLEAAMRTTSGAGLALFGHGNEAAVYGADDEAALDGDNVAGAWVHAFACKTGVRLARDAEAKGLACYLGYRVSLLVGWSAGELHPDLLAHLAALSTATTSALLRGVRSRSAIQREISEAADRLNDWIQDHEPDAHLGLGVLAEMLIERMVLVGRDVAD